MSRDLIEGLPCDTTHPYPTPRHGRWIDSMDHGDTSRLIETMYDRDTLPTWRAIAAYAWDQPCFEDHVTDVAADPILTTHLLASTSIAWPPHRGTSAARLGFSDEAGLMLAELRTGGLEKGRLLVNAMHLESRKSAVSNCVTYFYMGYHALQYDTGAHFPA